MKKIIPLLLAFSINVAASEPVATFSCKDIYTRVAESKMNVRNDQMPASYSVPFIAGTMAIAVPPLALVAGIGAIWAIHNTVLPSEEKVLLMLKAGDRLQKRLMKRVREVSPSATESEIETILEQGFTTGAFCKDFPVLLSKGEVIDYVVSKVKP